MATIYEVSELAGVSVATVSRVVNDSSRVSEKTRSKVLSAMEQLGYRPNSIAQALASHRSNCVGVLVSELYGAFFGAMLGAIEEALRAEGKFVIFAAGHSEEAKEKEGIRFLLSRNCDALILHVEAVPDAYLVELRKKEVPFVIVNRNVPGLSDRCISLDNERGGYLATRLLLQLGHRHIAYLSGPLSWGDARERLAGHKSALAEFGVALDRRLLFEGNYRESGGVEGMTRLIDGGIPFTAVVCANDEMAAGAMSVARERGLRVPENLSIVGFDNAPVSRHLYPRLSTVDYPVADMSRMAAHWILRNVYRAEGQKIRYLFEPSLLARESATRLTAGR